MGRTLLFIILACFVFYNLNLGEGIGVSWGRQTSQKLLPSTVVDMMLANGMDKVKFFSLNHAVLSAFAGSNISITVTIPNVEWKLLDSKPKADAWIKENITEYCHWNKVNITHILIGSEPYTKINNRAGWVGDDYNDTTYVQYVEPQLGYVEEALKVQGRSDIKATVSFFTDMLKPDIKKPSEGDFRDDVKDKVLKVLEHNNRTGAPFNVHIYPLNIIREKNLPLEFAFFEEDKKFTIEDGNNITYTNVFDATYDTIVWAKRKYGYDNVPIVVGQIGWPTDGDSYANISTATRFYQGLFKKIDGNVGTPLQRGPLDLYIYELVDENSKSTEIRGPTERHYGIYNYDGVPKFAVEFNGAGGQRKQLEPAQGVSYMPRRWCIFNGSKNIDPTQAEILMKSTCNKSDCTSLTYGSSCHGMDMKSNLSYAFNMFFQNRNQDILNKACYFEDYGIVVNYDPSPNEKCKFPLQILSTIFVGGQGEMGSVLPDAGETLDMALRFTILVQLLISFLFCFFWI